MRKVCNNNSHNVRPSTSLLIRDSDKNLDSGPDMNDELSRQEIVTAIKGHVLYPLFELLLVKCEKAMLEFSSEMRKMDDIKELLLKLIASEPEFGNTELDRFLFNAVIILRTHLLELGKIAGFCEEFTQKYLDLMKRKMNPEIIESDSGDEMENTTSSTEFTDNDQVHYMPNSSKCTALATLTTSNGLISIPLWNCGPFGLDISSGNRSTNVEMNEEIFAPPSKEDTSINAEHRILREHFRLSSDEQCSSKRKCLKDLFIQ